MIVSEAAQENVSLVGGQPAHQQQLKLTDQAMRSIFYINLLVNGQCVKQFISNIARV